VYAYIYIYIYIYPRIHMYEYIYIGALETSFSPDDLVGAIFGSCALLS